MVLVHLSPTAVVDVVCVVGSPCAELIVLDTAERTGQTGKAAGARRFVPRVGGYHVVMGRQATTVDL